jgi:hypothetical protein
MKVLVFGSRKWTARGPIERELRKLPEGTVVVHGGAAGADTIAGEVARELGFEVRRYPADWDRHGKAAGPIRNSEMITKEHTPEEPLDRGLGFTTDLATSPGTRDMMQKLKYKGIARVLYSE